MRRPKPNNEAAVEPRPVDAVERLLRLAQVAATLGISRRTFERERSAGRFPAPDIKIGKTPLWRPGTVQSWIVAQSRTKHNQGVVR